MNTLRTIPPKQGGTSMIEVLVTLVILLVGLLGLAGLQMQSQRSEMESYQRVQALILLQDMVGRINANRKVTTYQNVSVGTSATVTCTGTMTIAQQDLCQWHKAILGAAETSGITKIGAMIGGRGCITYNLGTPSTEIVNNTPNAVTSTLDGLPNTTAIGGDFQNSGIYTISVAWQGLGKTNAQPNNTCGKNKYGATAADDAQRRVVSFSLRLAPLGS